MDSLTGDKGLLCTAFGVACSAPKPVLGRNGMTINTSVVKTVKEEDSVRIIDKWRMDEGQSARIQCTELGVRG